MKRTAIFLVMGILVMTMGCNHTVKKTGKSFSGAKGEVKLMTLDPGHFHAALVQKTMYEQVDPEVFIFAPEGADVQEHLQRIKGFNSREEKPTTWVEKVYTGDDYFEQMISEKPGNVMMVSGKNSRKTEYIQKAAEAGINVYADKPMVITPEEFKYLEKAFQTAEQNGVLIYDIMTERHEITTILQKEFSRIPEVFGILEKGTPEDPAITKESVHHFFKYVSGNPLKRPFWFFDVGQQGDGMADVGTHLVDLIQWEAFPEEILKKEDVEIISARRWTTDLSPGMFKKVTHLEEYPESLQKYLVHDSLKVYCNGEINYKLKGVHAKISVIWNFQAPEGAGDTHYSIMRGSKCNLIIRQGEEENYRPTLYVEANNIESMGLFEKALNRAVNKTLAIQYPGLELVKVNGDTWRIDVPEKYKIGHEAHFGQVTEKYLQYLVDGKLPEWEVPNMIVKYYTTTEGLKKARE